MKSLAARCRSSIALAGCVLGLIFGAANNAVADPETSGQCQFRRGVNLPLEFRTSGPVSEVRARWPYLQPDGPDAADKRFRAIANAGFDFVRVSIDTIPLLTTADTESLITNLVDFVGQARGAGLCVVLGPWLLDWNQAWRAPAVFSDPAKTARYRDLLKDISRALSDQPGAIAGLELLNEPPGGCGGIPDFDWEPIQLELYRAVRTLSAKVPILLSGDCWSSLDSLIKIEARAFIPDPQAYFTFHFYEPQTFAEQGASKRCPMPQLSQIEYPATASCEQEALRETRAAIVADLPDASDRERCERAAAGMIAKYCQTQGFSSYIQRRIAMVRGWADAAGLDPGRVVVGEFGAISKGKAGRGGAWPDRLRWLTDVRQAIDAEGFGWAVWALGGGLTIECPAGPADVVCPSVQQALGLGN